MKPPFEVAEILQNNWKSIANGTLKLNSWQLRTLSAIKRCRTALLGGHIDLCSSCGYIQISYNSCRNRHCPKCQANKKEQWIQQRQSELLPVPYYHVVFTIPETLNVYALQYPRAVYSILFKASWQTIEAFSKDKKWIAAKMGMVAILHTWGQNLSLHPHLHCIVPGGGVNKQGKWKTAKVLKTGKASKILFPVKAISKVFRGKFVALLKKELPQIPYRFYPKRYKHKWVVYAKRPFGGPKQVIEYLGRYTHKIAISNHRIKNISNNSVSFTYKDYRQEAKKKTMSLTQKEFIRRFALHILPKRFVRIRHYGILSSYWKRNKLSELQDKLDFIPPAQLIQTKNHQCPKCKNHSLQVIFEFDARGPPKYWLEKIKKYKEKNIK
jgi:predicted Zn-ribbon and HTH transcriptional regulator